MDRISELRVVNTLCNATTSQPIGNTTRMQSTIANSARTTAERSVRKRDASARDATLHTLKILL